MRRQHPASFGGGSEEGCRGIRRRRSAPVPTPLHTPFAGSRPAGSGVARGWGAWEGRERGPGPTGNRPRARATVSSAHAWRCYPPRKLIDGPPRRMSVCRDRVNLAVDHDFEVIAEMGVQGVSSRTARATSKSSAASKRPRTPPARRASRRSSAPGASSPNESAGCGDDNCESTPRQPARHERAPARSGRPARSFRRRRRAPLPHLDSP